MGGLEVTKIGMLGVGSMGRAMSMLMGEGGYEVYYFDPSMHYPNQGLMKPQGIRLTRATPGDENMDQLEKACRDIHLDNKVHRTSGYDELCSKLGETKVFVFSTPHGGPADKCVESLKPYLKAGDVIIDCGNEHWENTERRQRDLDPKGVHYIGCGVSGGYQSARAGPSMSPGGSAEGLEKVMPFLRSIAAKDSQGRPCTNPVGPGGSGHYVKMVHNGIEQGMMSVIAEVWLLLTQGLGISDEEVSKIFKSWNGMGPLRDCFLIAIGVGIERAKDKDGQRVVSQIRGKVVQDVDEEEGTGTWTCEEAVARHVPAASILSAHLFRCASSDLARRMKNRKSAGSLKVKPQKLSVSSQEEFVEVLHSATYFCLLACFAQGLDLIRQKDKDKDWKLDYRSILQLWRGGCIIKAEHITDLLDIMYARGDHDPDDVLGNIEVGNELSGSYQATKRVVLKAVEADLFVPSISQTLEYYKYETSTHLPTQFMEAQLDYFGLHMYEKKNDPMRGVEKGEHHYEWKPAKGKLDE
ncbi:6-phosphogluconate dehydrogenase [Xylaria castorea]|nr:6-phosphogluconate dehydrogenase [Xylaria castorea]